MGYVVYGEKGSGSAIVELALSKAAVSYEVREVDLGKARQRSAEYAALNPQRKLPTLLTPGGEVLTESLAIVLTLDERHPSAHLLPKQNSAERAQALRWMTFVATELYPIVEINDYPERFAPASGAPAVREVARNLWRQRLLVIEQAIAGDPWLLVSGFSIADAYLAVVSRWAQQNEWRPGHVPRIEAIATAIGERTDVGAVWRRHFG